MSLNDIVNVVITRQTQTVTEEGFGIPMILGPSVQFTDRIRYYTSIDEVALDFPANTPEYIAAQDIFSQVISPDLIAIGRRQVDELEIDVETAMSGKNYTVVINGVTFTAPSNNTATYSILNLNADLVPQNRIAAVVNGTQVGTVTSIIDFDVDFVTGNLISPIVNGATLAPAVLYGVDQASTIASVATKISTATNVASATVTGPRQITVVFSTVGNNTVNAVNTLSGVTQPTATISEGGFLYATSSQATMQAIATQIETQFPTLTATVTNNGRTLTVVGPQDVTATLNSFQVKLGASQPGVTIINPLQPTSADTIAEDLADLINADSGLGVTASNNAGTLTLMNDVLGTAFTVRTSTDIISPNQARVKVTQVSPNQIYSVTINGVEFSYRAPLNVQSVAEIATGLFNVISLTKADLPIDVEDNLDGSFEITSIDSANTFSLSVTPDILTAEKGLLMLPLVATNPVADDLNAINNINSDWYALISTERTLQTVLDIAAWVEARIKIFGTASSDPTIINVDAGIDQTSIAARLQQLGYVRTFVMYHQDAPNDYPEAAWLGRVLPLEPGSETWKFKTLNGISYSNLTTTQQNRVFAKNANTYQFVGGVGITANGTMAQGEYIDIIRGIDWLTSRIQQFVFSILVNNPKIPYTDAGIPAIQAEVLRALKLGISNDFIAADPEPLVTVPLASEVPPTDKANRILRNVRFQATLSGAIHAVVIRGTVSV